MPIFLSTKQLCKPTKWNNFRSRPKNNSNYIKSSHSIVLTFMLTVKISVSWTKIFKLHVTFYILPFFIWTCVCQGILENSNLPYSIFKGKSWKINRWNQFFIENHNKRRFSASSLKTLKIDSCLAGKHLLRSQQIVEVLRVPFQTKKKSSTQEFSKNQKICLTKGKGSLKFLIALPLEIAFQSKCI